MYADPTSGRRHLSQRGLLESATSLDTNVYSGNQAAYGNDIASYPMTYRYIFGQNSEEIAANLNETVVFAPGQALDLSVEVYDREGRLFRDENDAVCTLEFVSG